MTKDENVYRLLQRHLDRQPVGFPAVSSGADVRLLRRLFTEEEAALALYISYRPARLEEIALKCGRPLDFVEQLLESMFSKGSIGRKERNGAALWFLIPLIIGIYENQDGRPSTAFLKDAVEYMSSLAYAKSFLQVKPSQMRTIPINKSLPASGRVAPYDQIRSLVSKASSPFVVLDCICRSTAKLKRQKCRMTKRSETCLGFGDMAAAVLRRGHGRSITKEEALAILAENEEEGLVFQPSGVQDPQFICSCCGCCCGMLTIQKKLPHPVDFWTTGFYAEVEKDLCSVCGNCADRCQVGAVALSSAGRVEVDRSRCIGCGQCATICPSGGIRLRAKQTAPIPPKDEEALFDQIAANRKGSWYGWAVLAKILVGMRQ